MAGAEGYASVPDEAAWDPTSGARAPSAAPSTAPRLAVLDHLDTVCVDSGLDELAEKLQGLQRWMQSDAAIIESLMGELATTHTGSPQQATEPTVVHTAAMSLLGRGGKRLRPLCVALASRVGTGFDGPAQQLAIAVELVHTATLLHDDVIDTGELRRGGIAPRILYGNAASIYAGDWMLIEAIRRVRAARIEHVLDRLLAIIEEMILAEAIQLERRGRIEPDRKSYFRVVEGKTAALFRWAMFAGAQAGGVTGAVADALESYGLHLGVAFQAMDDLLDLNGDPSTLGKSLFTDLREGKMTYPLIVAVEREPTLGAILQELLAGEHPHADGRAPTLDLKRFTRVREALVRTRAFDETRALARGRIDAAIASLAVAPAALTGRGHVAALEALELVAEATLLRSQ
jgi:octaprenyl-diphosphate synthase